MTPAGEKWKEKWKELTVFALVCCGFYLATHIASQKHVASNLTGVLQTFLAFAENTK